MLGERQPALIRRLSVVFSSVSSPVSCDYLITEQGFSVVPGSTTAVSATTLATAGTHASSGGTEHGEQAIPAASQLNVGCVEDSFVAEERQLDDDEWEAFWIENDLPDDVFDLGEPLPIPRT